MAPGPEKTRGVRGLPGTDKSGSKFVFYLSLAKDDSDIALQSSTFNFTIFGQYSDTVLGNR